MLDARKLFATEEYCASADALRSGHVARRVANDRRAGELDLGMIALCLQEQAGLRLAAIA
jgi:hypothetical protein